jgi:hypothetical protein
MADLNMKTLDGGSTTVGQDGIDALGSNLKTSPARTGC